MSFPRVLSVDIDGTLEIGEPPGIVPVALVRTAPAMHPAHSPTRESSVRYAFPRTPHPSPRPGALD